MDTIIARMNLAMLLASSGDVDAARPIVAEVVRRLSATVGDNHARTQQAREWLAAHPG
jgi:hypothetical protein